MNRAGKLTIIICYVCISSIFTTGTNENIALGRPAWQSSVYRTYDAHLAVDGNDAVRWSSGSCTHTEYAGEKYWAVDLGQGYFVKSLRIANRADCCSERLANFTVAVSAARPTNTSVPNNNPDFPVCYQHEGYPTDYAIVHCEPGPRWGRYVSVYTNLHDDAMTLCEVEVYDAQYNSSNYYLTGSEFTCDFLPSFHPSGSIDLDTCKAIHLYGEELCAFFLFRVLQQLKKGDVRVKLEGRGIDCSPVDGISMVAISTTGVPIPCKAYVGHRDGTGIISCSYSCSCSAGCIMFRVVFTDPTNKVICAFHV